MVPKAYQHNFDVTVTCYVDYSDNFLIIHIFIKLTNYFFKYNADFIAFQLNLNESIFKEYLLNKQSDGLLVNIYVYTLSYMSCYIT